MIVHIYQDSVGYFLTKSITRFWEIDKKCIFININGRTDIEIRNNIEVYSVPFNSSSILKLLLKYDFKKIVFHFYNYLTADILIKLKKRKIDFSSIWVFWSADFYNIPSLNKQFYDDFSFRYLNDKKKEKSQTFFYRIFNKIRRRNFIDFETFKRSVSLLDFFASFLPRDFEIVKEFFEVEFNYIKFSYISIEDVLDVNLDLKYNEGNGILVNHSSDPILNHIEVIDKLCTMNINKDFYFPLAYGEKDYSQKVEQYAFKNLDKNKVVLLKKFLGKNEYALWLDNMGFAVWGSRVQQGLGNLLILLWKGVKIYLRESSSTYQDFQAWGFNIYSIEKDLNVNSINTKLSFEQRVANRKKLIELFSEERINKMYKSLIYS